MNQQFPKAEHLCGEKTIGNLHTKGLALMAYPFRIVYLPVGDNVEKVRVRVMVSVSKKKFKKAVDRNRVKRLMREAYRQHKTEIWNFATEQNLYLHIAFQYVPTEILSFSEMSSRMKRATEKLIKIQTEKTKSNDENG